MDHVGIDVHKIVGNIKGRSQTRTFFLPDTGPF